MIVTDEQRRWWFATHPEFSWSNKGGGRGRGAEEKPAPGSPESVDAYVDEHLKYEKGPVATILKSFKREFGTQAATDNSESMQPGHTTAKEIADNQQENWQFGKYSNEDLRRMGIPTPEEEALISDPHTFFGPFPLSTVYYCPN